MFKSPQFWWRPAGWLARLFAPFSLVYGAIATARLQRSSIPEIDLPVLCIGNYSLGGAGKTPLAIALAKEAITRGFTPGFISRGYGRKSRALHRVNSQKDRARDVGDEALLLASYGPVALAKERLRAAQLLRDEGCDFIIMDDGFQSRRLYPDYVLIAIDALRGIGNRYVFPAGPLRAPLKIQLAYSDHAIIIGQGSGANQVADLLVQNKIPLAYGQMKPRSQTALVGKKFLAFSGIGNPEKFYRSVAEMGGIVVEKVEFADHHFFNERDLGKLLASSRAKNLQLITTAKDYVRLLSVFPKLKPHQDIFSANLAVVDVDIEFLDQGFGAKIINAVLEAFQKRKNRS